MAKFVLTDASVTIGGTDLSDHVRSVTIDLSVTLADLSAMGDTYMARGAGLKDAAMEIEFLQDFAASEVDATIFAAFGTAVAVTGKPTSASTSATNPEYQFTGIIETYQPIAGSLNSEATTTVRIPISTGAVVRATS